MAGWQDCGRFGYTLNFLSYIFKSYDVTNNALQIQAMWSLKTFIVAMNLQYLVNEYLAKLHQANCLAYKLKKTIKI